MKSDEICDIHKSHIYSNRTVMNMTLGLLGSGTGIAGGLVGGLGAANALSGSAGFLTGARSLMNEEVYHNYLAEAVIKEIENNRSNYLAKLKSQYPISPVLRDSHKDKQNTVGAEGSQNQQQQSNQGSMTDFSYTSSEVKRHIQEYHQLCSFYSGLVTLLAKAGEDTIQSDVRNGITARITTLKTDINALEEKINQVNKQIN